MMCKRSVLVFPFSYCSPFPPPAPSRVRSSASTWGFQATNDNYRAHVQDGATANPYVGYMFNEYLGVQGQLHFTFQEPDNDGRGFAKENQTTTLFGGTIGPRVSLPLGEFVELYGTAQGGVFTGLSGRLNHTAPGFSLGGGIDFNVTPQFAVGVFGRWNRAYMSPRPKDLGPRRRRPTVRGRRALGDRWPRPEIRLQRPSGQRPPRAASASSRAGAPAPPPAVKKKIVLRCVHFDFDKATIRPDAVPVLE